MQSLLRHIASGGLLSQAQAEEAMHTMMRGEASPEVIAGFLMGLRARGESLEELVGFTRVMREYAVRVEVEDPYAIDVCGTGGDGAGTFNISTATSLVCAGAGVTVAKHGNRSVSSNCGSSDVLEELGVQTMLDREAVEVCLREAGFAFLFAPLFHPAVRHVTPVRKALGARTFFNILGPMCNPANVRRQLVGAFSKDVASTMARIMARLGAERVVCVHSRDGLDEISLSDATDAYVAQEGDLEPSHIVIEPELFGVHRSPRTHLAGGTAKENAQIILGILAGRESAHRDVVVLNAAYGLYASGKWSTLKACFAAAVESIDSGAAKDRLNMVADISSRFQPVA